MQQCKKKKSINTVLLVWYCKILGKGYIFFLLTDQILTHIKFKHYLLVHRRYIFQKKWIILKSFWGKKEKCGQLPLWREGRKKKKKENPTGGVRSVKRREQTQESDFAVFGVDEKKLGCRFNQARLSLTSRNLSEMIEIKKNIYKKQKKNGIAFSRFTPIKVAVYYVGHIHTPKSHLTTPTHNTWRGKKRKCERKKIYIFLGWPEWLLTNYIWGQSSWRPLGNTGATSNSV